MEQKSTEQGLTPERLRPNPLKPPERTHFTEILNGIGNGTMLGLLPSVFNKLYEEITKKSLFGKWSEYLHGKAGGWLVGIGGIAGALYGKNEAEKILKYREQVNNEITSLRNDVDTNTQQMQRWQEKLAQQEKDKAAAPSPAEMSR